MTLENSVDQDKKKEADILMQINQLADARAIYSEVCDRSPEDAEALWGLAQANIKLGLHEEAAENYRHLVALNPQNGDAYLKLGIALQSQGLLDEARQSYLKARQFIPDSAAVHSNLGTILAKQGKLERAALSFERSLELDSESAPILYNLGAVCHALGRFDAAAERHKQALRIKPKWAEAHYSLATALLQLGKTAESIAGLQESLRLDPKQAGAWLHLGTALIVQGQHEAAIESLQQVIRLVPDEAQAFAKLAEAFERLNQIEEAQQAVDRALQLRPGLPIAILQAARLERRAGQCDKARDRLEDLLKRTLLPSTFIEVQVELGFVLDRLGQYDTAFEAFTQGHACAAAMPRAAQIDKAAFLDSVAKNRDWFSRERIAPWQDVLPEDGLPAPVFLVGFPRSGTTLTEQILASHRGIVTSNKRPILQRVLHEIREESSGSEAYPDILDQMDADRMRVLRAHYWATARELVGESIEGKQLVDKYPLNVVHLGLVRRLFPESKIIFVRRDPRDVCLSCFMQSFKLNWAMVNFFNIEQTAQAYTAVMGLWRHYRDVLGLEYLELPYEDLVFNLEPTARRLVDFIGEDWDPALLSFYEQAKSKKINTPSYQGVTSPIYTRSVGQWKHYREQLAPVLEALQPFVELFDYDQEAGKITNN